MEIITVSMFRSNALNFRNSKLIHKGIVGL